MPDRYWVPDVVPLPHALGGVVVLPEELQQRLVARDGGVEDHPHDLVVAGAPGADLLVGRVRRVSARVAHRRADDARRLPEHALRAPEAAHAEQRELGPLGEGRLERACRAPRGAPAPASARPAPAAPPRGSASAPSSSRTAPSRRLPIPSLALASRIAPSSPDGPSVARILRPVPPTQATIEAVREGSDLVELVRGRVSLVRRGGRWWGRCPFHDERTPSFSLLPPDFRRYYCHGCGATGDAIDWMREQEGAARASTRPSSSSPSASASRCASRRSRPATPPAARRPSAGGRCSSAPPPSTPSTSGGQTRPRRRGSTSPRAASARSSCGASASAMRPAAAPCWRGGRSARASRARPSSTPASPACAAARPPTSSPPGSRSPSRTARGGCRGSAGGRSTPASGPST